MNGLVTRTIPPVLQVVFWIKPHKNPNRRHLIPADAASNNKAPTAHTPPKPQTLMAELKLIKSSQRKHYGRNHGALITTNYKVGTKTQL